MFFDSVGDSNTVLFGGNVETIDQPGLSASVTYALTGIDANEAKFAITIANTTDATIWQDSRISRIGFDADPTVTAVSAEAPWVALLGGALPNEFGAIDICLKASSMGTCQGGPGGVSLGEAPVTFNLSMFFAGPFSGVTLSNYGVRYQSLVSEELGFSKDDEASGTGSPSTTTAVPEPGTLAMLGSGLLALVFATRRRRAI